MSSYLNFYLVPKKREGMVDNPKPLSFVSYSRNSGVYKSFYETLSPVFIGNGDEYNYSELSPSDVKRVLDEAKKDLQDVKDNFESRKKAYKELGNGKISEEAVDDFVSTEAYVKELEENICSLEGIYEWVSDLEYSDFEKVLINIG